MILTDYFYPDPDMTWDIARQCGIRYGTVRLPETDDFILNDEACWDRLCGRFADRGIRPLIIEPLPNKLHDHIKTGDDRRDESIDMFIGMLPVMRRHGITTVCFNFMAHTGWTRTDTALPERGGAAVTGFRLDRYHPSEERITAEALWKNYAYFVKAAVPEVEKNGIRLALHPDDPPLPALGNIERIMISLENIQRAMEICPSNYLGVTFCQACYYLMSSDLEETARQLRDRIMFIHFRNCRGSRTDFAETFHDNGEIDMARMIRLYHEMNLDVPIRVDHVPQMLSDQENAVPGYSAIGRLFAIGYLKGLLEGAGCGYR